ncbi:hypothetical protein DMN91_003545 [Ooceraea biroi]|uniref:Cytochrome P450 4c3 n=1 Tax=Ooceraea biroi TaxID=2015173 RepID=A0A026WUL5_OOCBI|nr:cytochrome P450 4c3 [Ooceraea biroi]EZA59707.1 Cytochrome P450 4c3 [Ooceraea biroi]RLU23341.1 hypothetical protein DMN91_003545 [Ooceraea biroi]
MSTENFENSMVERPWVTTKLQQLLFLCTMIALITKVIEKTRFLHALRKIPYPTALPIIGNAYQLNCTPEEFFQKMIQWSKEFGNIFLVWVASRPFIFLYTVEAVKPLLKSTTHTNKSLEYEYLKPWLGIGLVTNNGLKWYVRRKLLTPSFHSGLNDAYLKIIKKQSAILISCLHKEVGKCFDVVPYAKRAALDMICETSMGYYVNAQTNLNNEYVKAVDRIASIVQMRFTNVWVSWNPIFKLTKAGKEHDRSLNIIHSLVNKVIAERKRQRNGNSNRPSKKRQALLDLLLDISQNGTVLTDKDIREEVNTFMYAGHDTTATSISWALYVLGRHPEYQEKILNEYDEIIGTDEITTENINKLIWLDACIKEQWRLYPVVPLIARQIYEPIEILGIQVPRGSTVLINSYLLHRDARFFPEPHVYRPERFLPNSAKIPPFAFIPFSAGSRNCIGWKFATMFIKVAVVSVLKSFNIEAIEKEDDLRFKSELVLINTNGIQLKLMPR